MQFIIALFKSIFAPACKLISKEASVIRMIVEIDSKIPGIAESSFEACLPGEIIRKRRYIILPATFESKSLDRIPPNAIVVRCRKDDYKQAEKHGFVDALRVEFIVAGLRSTGKAFISYNDGSVSSRV